MPDIKATAPQTSITPFVPSSIEVTIAAHFNPARVRFLGHALRAVLGWQCDDVSITIVTNDMAIADAPELEAISNALDARGFRLEYDRAHSMEHPFHLTWWHKRRLREWHASGGSPNDLFIYIEDDIAIEWKSLKYFCDFLPALKGSGFIPGFMRYEIDESGSKMAVDQTITQIVDNSDILQFNGARFASSLYPYWAGFIMDRELCGEYISSPWFGRTSAELEPKARGHTCRVHSAWALTYWNVPERRPSRYLIPVDANLEPLDDCLVWHSANNYHGSNKDRFGSIEVSKIFASPGIAALIRVYLQKASQAGLMTLDRARRFLTRSRAPLHKGQLS